MDSMVHMYVRPARQQDRAALLALWERAVRATHHFLHEQDVVALRPLVREELASDLIDWWVLASPTGTPIGFLGMAGRSIEALFIDPEHRRQGGGQLLVMHAQELSGGPLSVEVNEQNEDGVRFYEALGFFVVNRSRTDAGGRPFPVLRMHRDR